MGGIVYYFTEDNGHGIGNLINITPAMKLYADHIGGRVPLFAISDVPGLLFEDCPFMKICYEFPAQWQEATGKRHERILGSNFKNYEIPDWSLAAAHVIEQFDIDGIWPDDIPHTYVSKGECPTFLLGIRDFVVVARGGESFKKMKDPGPQVYAAILNDLMERGITIIAVGNTQEVLFFRRMLRGYKNAYFIADNLKGALWAIANARFFVNCDSGLTHAAGALNTSSFILWKDTWFEKNRSPSKALTYSQKGNWYKDWDEFKKQNL